MKKELIWSNWWVKISGTDTYIDTLKNKTLTVRRLQSFMQRKRG